MRRAARPVARIVKIMIEELGSHAVNPRVISFRVEEGDAAVGPSP
jgi:hypothetical protein